jgi:pimeloyl-ACP methyl ester carboxylesterase
MMGSSLPDSPRHTRPQLEGDKAALCAPSTERLPEPAEAGEVAGDGSNLGNDDVDEENGLLASLALSSHFPSYPFPADFHLEFQGSYLKASRHLCMEHPTGTRAIAVFFPGVHGGVGPCRTPGQNFCPDALFPTVSQRLAEMRNVGIDCYRVSWPFMRPEVHYAVGGACRIVHHALLEAMRSTPPSAAIREVRVILVGHSLGGDVALQAAEVIARHFGADGEGGQQLEGLERAVVHVSGLCTLNGAFSIEQDREALGSLFGTRSLLCVGNADKVVSPMASRSLLEALPMHDKRLLELEGGTHDLFSHKEKLVHELVRFLLESAGGVVLAAQADSAE